jgi:hypothetical protein
MGLGAAVIVKSGTGAAETLTAAAAVWDREPAEPVTVTVAAEVSAAELEAVSVNWASFPGVTETVDGVAVTPAGRPLSETFTGLEKPPIAEAVTDRSWLEPPCWRVTAAGAAAIAKSDLPDEPHPTANTDMASSRRGRWGFLIRGVLLKIFEFLNAVFQATPFYDVWITFVPDLSRKWTKLIKSERRGATGCRHATYGQWREPGT